MAAAVAGVAGVARQALAAEAVGAIEGAAGQSAGQLLLPAAKGYYPWAGDILATTTSEDMLMYRVGFRSRWAGGNPDSDWYCGSGVWDARRWIANSVVGKYPVWELWKHPAPGSAVMAPLSYRAEGGQLLVHELPAGRILRRQTFELPVKQVLPLPAGDGCLVVLEYSATKKPTFDNLLKVGPDGSVVWRSALPDPEDSFTHVAIVDGRVEANTWTGYRVEIDPESGRITNTVFVK